MGRGGSRRPSRGPQPARPDACRCAFLGPSGGQPEVPVIRGQARLQRAGPAEPLKPGRDLRVIQIGMVPAVAADQLKHAGVAAFDTALNDTGRLAPQERYPPVPGLASRRDQQSIPRLRAGLRLPGSAPAARGPGAAGRPMTAHDVRSRGLTWPTPQASSACHRPDPGQRLAASMPSTWLLPGKRPAALSITVSGQRQTKPRTPCPASARQHSDALWKGAPWCEHVQPAGPAFCQPVQGLAALAQEPLRPSFGVPSSGRAADTLRGRPGRPCPAQGRPFHDR